ncbi:alkaline phosphatase family protein [Catellatospora chokoriensis]|uniref:Phosphoesterase n=2 Tax=Catellatospora chokoriensis TaxID=310353 RepID=A0A8J3NV21_9ACTN|nr:alkaline phosphatase family protein [Catellatospora chokoriensis]GIF91805.1 phosphoesterase [Catellatospora chokoriensis]
MVGQRGDALFDHVVVVMFENRSFDNLLGYLYEPGEVASFEGVAGRDLANPIPSYAPGAERGVVPVHVATSMDAPNPDAGEEHPHTNTQLFGTVAPEGNRFLPAEQMRPPFNAPDDPAREPTMDGFVQDYVNTFRSETGRLPEYDEYAQIMSCYTPQQVPVISAIARGFAVFDHWFCEVPSQTFTNRSFYHAGTASGLVVNAPYESFPRHNDAETIFNRLDAAGLPWRVYVDPGMPFSLTGMIHTPRLSPHFASRFSTLDDFFADAEQGRLPAYSFLEPNLLHAHNDYHPAYNAIMPGFSADPPSSILGGEELLARVYSAVRASASPTGSNFANTLLLVSFDEHGGTYDHVPPPRVVPPDVAAAGQMGFRFDRSGIRVPTLAVSAYLDPRTVVTAEYRNTSLIRTLRERFSLGPPLTARDATAADIAPILTRATPRAQEDWPEVTARPVPPLHDPLVALDQPLPPLGEYLLGTAIALDTMNTGHVPDIDPRTATGREARAYMADRQARIWPGLTPR